MSWLSITIIAYTLIAGGVILDKFLLSPKKISHPVIYTFYSGALSLTAFFFFPFGFHPVSPEFGISSLLSGMIFTVGILALFSALSKNEASQVTATVGAVTPVTSFFLSFFLLEENLAIGQIWGVFSLILGGILISLDFSRFKFSQEANFFPGFMLSILAGIFLGAGFTFFKILFEQDNFINVYIWTRLGLLIGVMSFFLYPKWRKMIWQSLKKFKKPKIAQRRIGLLFIFNKSLNGAGSFLLNLAISLGSVTIVNALIAIEYALVFLFGIGLSFWLPKYFFERKNFGSFIQKSSAIAIIAVGLFLIA